MKRFLVLFGLGLLSTVLFACQEEAAIQKTYVLEEEVVEEEVLAEPIEEDALTALRDEIQDEMYIFDVVEHHEDIYTLVVDAVTPSMDAETLNDTIASVVKTYMDEKLRIRIDQGLKAIQEDYRQEDAQWIFDTVSTHSLYNLITVYEREYYKDQMGIVD